MFTTMRRLGIAVPNPNQSDPNTTRRLMAERFFPAVDREISEMEAMADSLTKRATRLRNAFTRAAEMARQSTEEAD